MNEGGGRGESGAFHYSGQTFTSPSHWSVSDAPFVFGKAGHSSKAAIKSRTFSPIIPLTWSPTPSPADVPVSAFGWAVAHFCPKKKKKFKSSATCAFIEPELCRTEDSAPPTLRCVFHSALWPVAIEIKRQPRAVDSRLCVKETWSGPLTRSRFHPEKKKKEY